MRARTFRTLAAGLALALAPLAALGRPQGPAPGPEDSAAELRRQAPPPGDARQPAPSGAPAPAQDDLSRQPPPTQPPPTQGRLVVAPEPEEPPAPPARREDWGGSLAEGLLEMQRLAEEGEAARAATIGDALLAPTDFLRWWRGVRREGSRWTRPLLSLADAAVDGLGAGGYPPAVRAEVHQARGLVLLADPDADTDRAAAREDFQSARALAGPGALRLDATYDLGLAFLLDGEGWRARIPEIAGTPPPAVAPPPAAPAPAAQGEEEEPQPIDLAQRAYEDAREWLVQRLRADWRDADTRANVELVQRRLRELEEIRRQREEQQQQQQQQQQDQDEQQSDQQQSESQDQQGESQDGDGDEQQDPSEQEQQQQQQEEDEGEQDEPQPEEQQDEQAEDEQPQDAQDQEGGAEEEAEPQEVYLTKEEVQRLLDRLRAHEQAGEEQRAAKRAARRRNVPEDW